MSASQKPKINLRRTVERAEFVLNREGSYAGRWALFLDCGHVVFQEGRIPVPKQARCPECKRMALGLG